MNTEEKEFYKLLARSNYKGITTDQLVYSIKDARDELDHKLDEVHKFILEESVKAMMEEIERRRKLTYNQAPDKEIIQTIKNSVDIADVLAWYTDVFTHKKQWTYRCTLHGADKHPSGVIYKDDQKFHCFVCQKHGDVFDAVMEFEGVDLPTAIRKLARHVGIDFKPLIPGKQNTPVTREELDNLEGHFKNLDKRVFDLEGKSPRKHKPKYK